MVVLRQANKGKQFKILLDGEGEFERYPVKTPLIKKGDDLLQILKNELEGFEQDGDILLVAESVVAISEGRAFEFDKIQAGFFAKLLSHFVSKTPHGIGLGTPETMQLAIDEVGLFRILLAAFAHAVTRPFGFRGNFYRIAGERVRGIDGPTEGTIPPYDRFASLIPKDSAGFARKMQEALLPKKVKVIVIDANDIGVNILAEKNKYYAELAKKLASDNPLGQGSESTPALLCRKIS